ncbi:MAG: hypothetical protein ACHP7K_01410 [Actinomycetales bacterium]
MSTTTAPAPASRHTAGSHALSFGGVLRSEWIKFRSLPSTVILSIAAFVAVVGIAALVAFIRVQAITSIMNGTGGPRGPGAVPGAVPVQLTAEQAEKVLPPSFSLYNMPDAGLQIGILVLGSLAVLFLASEYGTGMIRSTFTAVPRRIPAFAAKAVVLVVVSYVLTTIAAVVSFLIALPIINSANLGLDFARDGVISSIFMGGLYVAGVSLIGLSLAALVRNSAGAIAILMGMFFLLPFAANFLALIPGDFWKYVPQYIPSETGGQMLAIGHVDGVLDPLPAGLIFLGYVLVFLIPAVLTVKRRDV